MPPWLILVAGATGQQGSAFIRATRSRYLRGLEEPPQRFQILALTRNVQSQAARALGAEEHVTLVEGDLNDPPSVRKIFEDPKYKNSIWGVFCVLAFPGLGANAEAEEQQGKNLADIAFGFGVSCFVLSTLERGGEKDDDTLELDRLAKVRIERHVRELGKRGLPWTLLRPGFFMENYNGFIGSITVAVLHTGLNPLTKVRLVAVQHIGEVAAGVFEQPETFKFNVLSVYGDQLTMAEQEKIYKDVTRKSMTRFPTFLARLLIAINDHTRNLISDFERIDAIIANGEHPNADTELEAARVAHPQMTTFKAWVEQMHDKNSGTRSHMWNQVSIFRLFTGKL